MTPEEVMRQLLDDMQQANADHKRRTSIDGWEDRWAALENLYSKSDQAWRSADGKVWRLDPSDPGAAPVISPTHAERVVDHLRKLYLPADASAEMTDYFECAIPLVQALKHRIEQATQVEWVDAKWRDWMWRKAHPGWDDADS